MTRAPVESGEPAWRVVIVDDNSDDRSDMRRLLLQGSNRRYEFIETRTGAAGIRAIIESPSWPPDCVLLDYHLPDYDALEVLAELAGPSGDGVCPVVVVTGSTGQAVGRTVLRAGAQDFIGKAWMTAESLTRAVENAVDRWAMAQELRVIERALQARERELRTLADNTPDLIMRFDRELRYVFINAAVERATGRPQAELLGKTNRELGMSADHRDQWDAACQSVLRTGQPVSVEIDLQSPDGKRHYDSRMVAEVGPDGEVEFILAVTHDATDRREAAAVVQAALGQAQQAVRSRDELTSLVSHDLKNPLNAMVLGIALLEDEVGEEGREILAKMERQAQRMNKMIDELIDAAQLNAGMPLALALRETDLIKLTRVVAKEYQDAAPEHRIEIQAATDPLVGRWDPKRLDRVVNNLLSNAVKYSPRGGRVQVELESARDGDTMWALLRITDEGIGIGADDKDRVFQWYSRGDNALRTTIPGTGIGLAGVRDIVEQHGGTISVESEEGRGSTFTVRLPTEPQPRP